MYLRLTLESRFVDACGWLLGRICCSLSNTQASSEWCYLAQSALSGAGVERANSLSWNPHKMLGIPLQCSALLVQTPDVIHMIDVF